MAENKIELFLIVTHFIIAYHIFLVKVQTNYCNNNPLALGVKQLNEIIKLYYFYTLKALWDGQGKIKMGCPRLKSSYRKKGLLMIIFKIVEEILINPLRKKYRFHLMTN